MVRGFVSELVSPSREACTLVHNNNLKGDETWKP